MKLQRKLLLSYLVLVLLPLLSTTYFLIDKITKETINQSVLINKVNYEQLKDNVNNLFNSYTMLCDNMSAETYLKQYLSVSPNQINEYIDQYFSFYNISNRFANKYVSYTLIDLKVSLYSNNPSLLYDNVFTKQIDENVKKEQWYKDTLASKELNNILTPFNDYTGKYKIPISQIINMNNGTINILRIDIPEVLLWDLIKKESVNKNIYILNSAGYVLTSTSRDLIGSNISKIKVDVKAKSINLDETSLSIFSMPSNITFNDAPSTKFPKDKCKVITTIPSLSILGKTNEIIKYGLLVCLFTILVAIIFILIFSNTFVSRLKRLVTTMCNMKEDNLDLYISYTEKDEIGELSRSFKGMLDRIHTLVNEVYTNNLRLKDVELDKKDLKLKALQSQMNPHFLFNTLESIRMSVLKNGDSETSEIIESFGKLLRTSIEWKDSFIPLSQEIDLVYKYLKIQSFRYRNRFSFNINISSNLRNITTPKFILQPIVENAIYHGVEMKKGKGTINVYAYLIDNDLKIIVRDNGLGISKSKLSELMSSIQNSESVSSRSSIGMGNINQRLKLLYGDAYGITIYSKKNKGTKIEILMPIDREGGN